jgi:hypothetical protein
MINAADLPLSAVHSRETPPDSGWTPILVGGAAGCLAFQGLRTFMPNAPIIGSIAAGALASGVTYSLTASLCQPPALDKTPLKETKTQEVLVPLSQRVVEVQGPIPPIVPLMKQVIAAKEKNMNDRLKTWWHEYNIILISGDLFSFGYFGLLAVQNLAMVSMGISIPICGIIAGAINIRVSFLALQEGLQAWENGTWESRCHAIRMFVDFAVYFTIGVVMIMTSAAFLGAEGGGVVSVASCPCLLPVLFFVASIPVFIELCKGIHQVFNSHDMGSRLKLDELEKLVNEEKWDEVWEFYNKTDTPLNLGNLEDDPKKMIPILSKKMEELTAGTSIGIEAGLEAFRLLELILKKADKKALLDQILETKQKVIEWNNSLYLRLLQQVLYLIGFAIAMTAFHVNPNLLNGIQNILLFGANVIPFYMDICWPFRRNTPMVVEKINENQLVASLGTAAQAVNA